jgi:glycosyltransferase 2 family protein
MTEPTSLGLPLPKPDAAPYPPLSTVGKSSRWRQRAVPVLGTFLGIAGLIWILAALDYARLRTILAEANMTYLLLVPLAIAAEQLVRAWKWSHLLHALRRIGTMRLFGAIMTGHLVNLLVPLGVSPLVRSWLVARLDGLAMSAVLATVALDRLIDGVIFTGIVALVVLFAAFPDRDGDIRFAFILGGITSLAIFILLAVMLNRHKVQMTARAGWLLRLAASLPTRFAARAQAFLISFAGGIVWPLERWRRICIVAASIVIKLIATTHFLLAGLAFDVLLRPFDYLFLIVFFGFLVVLTHIARIPGGFVVGAVFALGLFGVGEERALAMVAVVIASNMIAIGVVGVFTLWRHGITLADLRAREANADGHT